MKSIWRNREGGQTVEYALIAALIVVGLLTALNAIGTSTKAMYDNLDSKWDEAGGS
jgi:Flp pilus assembly protein, pilin Flp